MLSISPASLVHWIQQFPADMIMLGFFVFCCVMLLVLMRAFGAVGLMVYAPIAVIAGNIQALTATKFSFFAHPVALGTVAFSSLFLCSDILTENYGKSKAQQSVWLAFTGMLLLTIMMLVTLSYPTVSGGIYQRFQTAHDAISILFMPAPAILIASLVAYVVAQLNDIWIFAAISRLTAGKLLWLRTLASTIIGAFIDNLVFSSLAWIILAPNPLDWHTTFYTYVLGTFFIRVGISVVGVPFIYLSRLCVKK